MVQGTNQNFLSLLRFHEVSSVSIWMDGVSGQTKQNKYSQGVAKGKNRSGLAIEPP